QHTVRMTPPRRSALSPYTTLFRSESQQALDHLGRVFPQVSGTSAQLVLLVPEGERVDTPQIKQAMERAVDRIEKVDQVAAVLNPFDKNVNGAVSEDKRAAMLAVPLEVDLTHVDPDPRTALSDIGHVLAEQAGEGAKIYTGGDAFSDRVPE